MSDPNPALAYERLKAETAQMLRLDGANLSLVENLQVDLIAMLRLQIDDLQGQVLNGAQVDLGRLSTSLAMLRQLLPEKALVAPAPAPEERGDSAAFNQVAAQIDHLIAADELKMAQDPDAARRELELKIQTAIAKHGNTNPDPAMGIGHIAITDPAGGFARHDGVVSRPALIEPAATVSGGWPDASPPQSAPPPKRESDEEKHARINAVQPPDRYLKSAEPEPWRDYVNSDGSINTSPWRRY